MRLQSAILLATIVVLVHTDTSASKLLSTVDAPIARLLRSNAAAKDDGEERWLFNFQAITNALDRIFMRTTKKKLLDAINKEQFEAGGLASKDFDVWMILAKSHDVDPVPLLRRRIGDKTLQKMVDNANSVQPINYQTQKYVRTIQNGLDRASLNRFNMISTW